MNAIENNTSLSNGQEPSAASGTSRREILKSLGRYGALLGLLGGVGTLAARAKCQSSPCSACAVFARCDLSKARDARDAGRRQGRS